MANSYPVFSKTGEGRKPVILAIGCHPDDIEFMMSGTLIRLYDIGAEIHYMNLANGNCGSREFGRDELAAIRAKEAQAAADYIGASWYPPIENDLEVTYSLDLVQKTASVVRKAAPDIILTPALHDYMEDHMNTARIAATAAFTIAMPNFPVIPHVDSLVKNIALYHALPYGLHDMLSNRTIPQFYIDVSSVLSRKQQMLGLHASQRNWLDESQRLDSYLQTMVDQDREVGRMSGCYEFAEGWIQHNPLGYGDAGFKPLQDLFC
ncbi:MAG: PIG-L family deacetylase [Spirochaetes bacterium]|nr:PIG-L family deacetylase [Spirochaetota bacterium]